MSTQRFAQSSTNDDVVVAAGDNRKRRTSARVPEAKRPNYGPVPFSSLIKKTETKTKTKTNKGTKTSSNVGVSTSTSQQQQQQQPRTGTNPIGSTSTSISEISASYRYIDHPEEDIAKVEATIGVYNKHRLTYSSDEKVAAKYREAKKMKNGGADKKQIKRPDLYATSTMKKREEILWPGKRIGHLRGIPVGRQFGSRCEMVAVGLHTHWLNGIDTIGKDYKKKYEGKGYSFPLAVSVIFSGQYEDDTDDKDEIIYIGQGGNDLLGKKKQKKDQTLTSGNLALKNSMDHNVPVRFIRGHPNTEKEEKGGNKLFTYDGLYQVVSYKFEAGQSGPKVYKFTLKRLEGQPELKTDKVEYKHGRSSNVPPKSLVCPDLARLVCPDLADGQENQPIRVVNAIDDNTITGFTYINSLQVPSSIELPPNAAGCKCRGDCTDRKSCACAKLNGGDFPYVYTNGGRLLKPKDVVYECGPNCGCGPDCINRVSQRKMKYELEVFRTLDRGWAVKTRVRIPSGAPVCEYIGQLKRASDMVDAVSNEYIFNIDCEQTMQGIGGRERRQGGASGSDSEQAHLAAVESEPEFCIDGGTTGNVARFINHSCDPNMFVQCVVSSHHDLKLARIVFVAAQTIPENTELTYDYGYPLDSVDSIVDENGEVKKLTCCCGASNCRGRLY